MAKGLIRKKIICQFLPPGGSTFSELLYQLLCNKNTPKSWANLGKQDETWAEFSTLKVYVFVFTMHLHPQKQPNLKYKTRPKQLLGSISLALIQ
jgi:hypothetical protein